MIMKTLLIALLLILSAASLYPGCTQRPADLAGTRLSFETTDFNGEPVSSEDIFSQHEITMLNLWASWCGPCVGELAELEEVNEALAGMDGAVVGLLNDGNGRADAETAQKYLNENGVTYLNILPPANLNEMIPQRVFPTTVFVNRDGVIIGKTLYGTTSKGKIVSYYLDAAKDALAKNNTENIGTETPGSQK